MADAQAKASFWDMDDSLGSYLGEIASSKPLSSAQEVELAQRIKQGDEDARNKLVEANLRFVVSVGKEYQNRGVPLADLISAGNVGLITAAERFDENRGFKFISYAVWWIRQAILQTLAEQSRTVRLPLNKVGLLYKISKASRRLRQQRADDPPPEEIAAALEVSVEEVKETMLCGRSVRSLDATFRDEEDHSLLDVLPDDRQESAEITVMKGCLRGQIDTVLEDLVSREAEILKLYFGLDGEEPMTLDQIGSRYGLTRERVRQIKEKALHRLRHPSRCDQLRTYSRA
ncbi:MAG: RNA polymerase sigma factor RpoD/SigA [Gemmatimonadetes bacterium]|jgi:RNA polymerase primary sigma factor|nr:RNA polymerase sigma factor RpoD/SigA [Gemmatimonadota bacterium]MBT4609107.1 RNA polymerase sigma factor RpoD/SigA [Gemmatimonadota bacterium]MBT5059042.1 RNA polymerase sigma factor RpoD/SigA [Gemmatimonadota bacterium]MBT5141879.1 RNA polymerase sigma factor RpoD/SigA [Gemmatimonadota bacterium]MBT5589832.1 RNA polymerase sigma factor RpoD/SigA [Gemmatimonadota bacterium]